MQKTLANELENKKDKQSKIEQWNDSVIDLWKRLEAHITIKHPEDTTAPIPIQAVNIAPAPPIPGLCMLYFWWTSHYISLFTVTEIEISGSEYSADDVASFLQRIGMKEHVQKFLSEEITGEDLVTADDDLLKELGVQSALQRNKLRKEFKKTIRK